MYVLVTRPAEDAENLLRALEARGHQALLAPLLTIAPNKDPPGPPELTGVQALLFTSANGVRAFAGLSDWRDLPVFTVGDASAAAARQAGFARVEGAGGEVQLTDALQAVLDRVPFHGLRIDGRRFDCGSKMGFVEANVAFAAERDDLGADVLDILKPYV